MSDYLWDKQGEPDPEVEQLERLLATARLIVRRPLPPLPPRRRAPRGLDRRRWRSVASALVALLVARPWRPHVQRGGVTAPALPRAPAGRRPFAARGDRRRSADRDRGSGVSPRCRRWLDRDRRQGRVQLRVADIGTVDLAPGTRARIVADRRPRNAASCSSTTERSWRRWTRRRGRFVVETPHCAGDRSRLRLHAHRRRSGQGRAAWSRAGKVRARATAPRARSSCRPAPSAPFRADEGPRRCTPVPPSRRASPAREAHGRRRRTKEIRAPNARNAKRQARGTRHARLRRRRLPRRTPPRPVATPPRPRIGAANPDEVIEARGAAPGSEA